MAVVLSRSLLLSRPTRARGLKLYIWGVYSLISVVAPHAGAWIETIMDGGNAEYAPSRPTRARGLKHEDVTNTLGIK